MAGPLTEVTLGVRLPQDPLTSWLAEHPLARIVLTPLSSNGTRPPDRYLVNVNNPGPDPASVEDPLALYLRDLERVHEDPATGYAFIGELRPEIRQQIGELMATALEGVHGEVIHRPLVLCGNQAYFCLITTKAGPLEQGMQRVIDELNGRGLQARLLRIGPHRPAHSLGTYEESLTEKQSEFLRVALALGLYDTPRRITLESIASLFGISKAAAHNRMRNAERKVLSQYFGT